MENRNLSVVSSDHLNILLSYDLSPLSNACAAQFGLYRTKRCPDPGIVSEVMGYIFRKLQVKYTITDWSKRLSDTPFNQVLQLVINQTFDTTIVQLTPSEERQKRGLQFSYPIRALQESLAAVSSINERPDVYKTSMMILNVFSLNFWSACTVLLLVYFTFDKFLPYFLRKRHPKVAKTSKSAAILLSFYLAAFSNLFQSGLLANLLTRAEQPNFRNMEELTKLILENQVKLLFNLGNNWHSATMNGAHSQVQINLRTALQKNEPLEMGSRNGQRYWPDIANGNVVAIRSNHSAIGIALQIAGTKVTPLRDMAVYINSIAFSPKVDRNLIKKVNQLILKDAHVFDRILRRYEKNQERALQVQVDKHRDQPNEDLPGTPFNLINLLGMFVVLCAGCLAGMIALLTEINMKHSEQGCKGCCTIQTEALDNKDASAMW